MLKKKYVKIITIFLHLFNYNKIENPNGSNHIILNCSELILTLTYALISFWKLGDVTKLVFILNFLSLLKLMVVNLKESINLREKYKEKYLMKPGLLFKSGFDLKLIIELCVISFVLVPFWVQNVIFEEYVIKSFAGIIIVLGFFENAINICVELFKASIDIEKLKVE